MKCKHCGAEIPEWLDFCPECAKNVDEPAEAPKTEVAAAPPAAKNPAAPKRASAVANAYDDEEEDLEPEVYQSPQRPKKTRRRRGKKGHGFLWFLLGVLLTAAAAAALMHFGILPFTKSADQPIIVSADSAFDEPADAITAYANGLKDGDLKEMLKTFAAETYLQHTPTSQYYNVDFASGEALKVWGTSSAELQAAGTPLSQALAAEKVRSYLVERIMDQFSYPLYHNSTYYTYDEERAQYMIVAPSEDDMNTFIAQLPENAPFKDVVIGEAFEVSDKLSKESAEAYKEQMEVQKATFGAEDVKFYYLELTIDGEDYLLGMEIVQYNGKWYNNDLYLYGINLKEGFANNSYGGLVPVAAIDSWM